VWDNYSSWRLPPCVSTEHHHVSYTLALFDRAAALAPATAPPRALPNGWFWCGSIPETAREAQNSFHIGGRATFFSWLRQAPPPLLNLAPVIQVVTFPSGEDDEARRCRGEGRAETARGTARRRRRGILVWFSESNKKVWVLHSYRYILVLLECQRFQKCD
jgi:hypothetical protein